MIAAVIDHLWQSTLFCAGAWLITLALRSHSAALRYSVWLVASLKFLVPFTALYLFGALVGLPTRIDAQPVFLDQAMRAAVPVVSPIYTLRVTEADVAAGFGATVFALWLCGSLVVALRWFLGWRAAESIVRAARPAPGAPAEARITDADIEPAVARIFHPVVLLPAALLGRLSAAEMDAILAHENEHINRRDNLKATLHRLVETLFWFHPMVWWIGRRMLAERELACDEAVIEKGHDAHEYAAGILAVCRHCCNSAGTPNTASVVSGNLTQRVRSILSAARPASLGLLAAVALATFTTVVAAGPLFAGAFDDASHRGAILAMNTRALRDADVYLDFAAVHAGDSERIVARDRVVVIHDSTLRDIVGMAYGVRSFEVLGGGEWMDTTRYDVRLVASQPVREAASFDPRALRGAITKLLAQHFEIEIHVNSRCQSPCGRYALTAPDPTH